MLYLKIDTPVSTFIIPHLLQAPGAVLASLAQLRIKDHLTSKPLQAPSMKGPRNLIRYASVLATGIPLAWSQRCLDNPENNIGASVHTSSGLIEGHAAPRRAEVSEYLGIPYASPPIGDLRFAAPVAYHSKERVHANAYVSDLFLVAGLHG